MSAEREKSMLMVEILEQFAPYMDKSTGLFKEMGFLISNLGSMIESFSELPDDKKMELMNFITTFNSYIEHASQNYTELNSFYSYLATKTNNIIADYKASMGME
jgi:hypothetical protein